MTTTFMTWKWGRKYGPHYVNRLAAGVARNYVGDHRFLCVTDDPEGLDVETTPILDPDLTAFRDGCYARLRCFDREWLERLGIERLVWLDLDLVITGNINPLFDRDDPLVSLEGAHFNPCRVNGSVLMMRRGAWPEIWSWFSLERAEAVANADGTWRGTDQTWIAHVAPDVASWRAGPSSGVYAYRKPFWPACDALPADARIVAFPGKKDPSDLGHLPWVQEHWRA